MVPDAEGGLEPGLVAELKGYLAAGVLPDGWPLKILDLLAPTRASALSLAPLAQQMGVRHVMYRDAEGTYWNTHPEDVDPP